jgi:hypothetical protein
MTKRAVGPKTWWWRKKGVVAKNKSRRRLARFVHVIEVPKKMMAMCGTVQFISHLKPRLSAQQGPENRVRFVE